MNGNTFYHGDCLFVLNHDVAPESVDLVYLDPPFFTGKVQRGTKKWQPGAMEISFEDRREYWAEHLDNMRRNAPIWLGSIAVNRPEFASYLYYMMERLQACYKVLKRTGSIYLHSDYRAAHYLKLVMDEIFTPAKFANEIIWHYKTGGVSERFFSRKHDTLFLYSKGEACKFTPQKEKSYLTHKYGFSNVQIHQDNHGYFTFVNMRDVWDIPALRGNQPETTGYPTQKPEALLERIIKASSDERDLVLDPFCGCGTAAIVASKLNRRFIGIDIHPTAFEVIKNRSYELFAQSRYVSRDFEEVMKMSAYGFQDWINEFFEATKPSIDAGVDGITKDGIPIQVKTGIVNYAIVSQFLTDAQMHPQVPQPVRQIVIASRAGFDDSARNRAFQISAKRGIVVELKELKQLLLG